MDITVNTAKKYLLIKDMEDLIDFEALNAEYNKLKWVANKQNKISGNKNFLDHPSLQGTKDVIVAECRRYLDGCDGIKNLWTDIKVTTSWGNLTEPKSSHHLHEHPFSVLSGVIYLDNNPSNLNLVFGGWLPEIPYLGKENNSSIKLKSLLKDINMDAEVNKNLQHHLLLFLSNTWHQVLPDMETTIPRRSVSFNTFWVGRVGDPLEALNNYTYK